jgi:acyl-CoA synthetase (AMP-forming)/AMP-acid ligase II
LADTEIAAFQQRFGVPLLMVWGLTETCCGATLMGLGHAQRPEHQNLGRALRGWEVRAVDSSGLTVPTGEHGELFVASPGIMSGYHRDEEATRLTIRDGFVATGDLGFVDDEGYVHFVSRIKDMLKPNGENVAAQEIADALERHPDVEEAAAFGVDDPITAERVIAAVVLRAGRTPAMSDLREHCSTLLAAFKVPSQIYAVESIPKTSIGKQQVTALKTRYLESSAR